MGKFRINLRWQNFAGKVVLNFTFSLLAYFLLWSKDFVVSCLGDDPRAMVTPLHKPLVWEWGYINMKSYSMVMQTCVPTYLPTYLLTYLPTNIPTYLHAKHIKFKATEVQIERRVRIMALADRSIGYCQVYGSDNFSRSFQYVTMDGS